MKRVRETAPPEGFRYQADVLHTEWEQSIPPWMPSATPSPSEA